MRAFLGFCFAVACVLGALLLVTGDAWAGNLLSPEAEANAKARATAHGTGIGIANAHQNQHQGQLQGQQQKSVNKNHNANVNVLDVYSPSYANATGGTSFSGAHSGTYGSGNSNVNVEGDDFDFPANSAPGSFATACSQGVGAQWMTGGGSVATTNPVCDWLAIADATKHAKDSAMYKAAIAHAYAAAKKRDNTSVASMILVKFRGIITLGLL